MTLAPTVRYSLVWLPAGFWDWHFVCFRGEQRATQSIQGETCMNHQKKSNFNPRWLWIYVTVVVCVSVEVLPTGEGDVRRLSKDRVPAGETGGSSARLPQELLPLCSLQHKAQVSRFLNFLFSFFIMSFDVFWPQWLTKNHKQGKLQNNTFATLYL